MNARVREMGERHRRRDEATLLDAQRLSDHQQARATAGLLRWPVIVQAIRSRVASYNDGAGTDAISVQEHADDSTKVTVQSTRCSKSGLVITLDGTELQVLSIDHDGPLNGSGRWIDLSRSDDDTAAYLLENWIQQL
jgi:hypothetical protein